MTADAILAIDQGTTSTRAIVFDRAGAVLATAQEELPQVFPRDGWVEHEPEEIWRATVNVCRAVIEQLGGPPAAVGITNQRETTVLWDRKTGKPIYNAIVWQDRRGAALCRTLKDQGHEPMVQGRTGLPLDSYFSATKIAWLLDEVPDARARAERGELAFGTIDSFLLWRLTGGQVHATDATNASRTLLYDIHDGLWDQELLDLFGVPAALLPDVRDSATDFGLCEADLFGASVPIAGIAGDQQAAAFGQACFDPGMIKSTYGTGCFVLMNTGATAHEPANGLLTTIAYRLKGETRYAVEGSIFNAGTTVQWLRDNLGLLDDAAETGALAAGLDGNHGVYFVPAFTGLGAPHWDPDARGAILGLTRDTAAGHIVRAGLEAVCYQTRDLLDAMAAVAANEDGGAALLRVDGGMAANDWLMQFLADMTGTAVERPTVTETTALGAAYLAGLQAGLFDSIEDVARQWVLGRRFEPTMAERKRARLYDGWQRAVERVRSAVD